MNSIISRISRLRLQISAENIAETLPEKHPIPIPTYPVISTEMKRDRLMDVGT